MRETAVAGGTLPPLPVIGQGTWGMGERPERRRQEVEALRRGFALGMRVVDTAEVYGAGGAEEVVGEAVRDCRDQVFLVTKVWPSHAAPDAVFAAVRASLRRLCTGWVDAVLLHWPTDAVPLEATLWAFERLVREGLARHVGVSNFTPARLGRALALGGVPPLALHEVRYGLDERRAERALIPEAAAHGRLILAYSPLAHGRLRRHRGFPALARVAARRGVSPERVALAWSVARPGVVAIPKAVDPAHVDDNAAAADLELTPEERAELEAAFPVRPGAGPPGLPPAGWLHRLAWAYMEARYGRREGGPASR